MKNYLAPLGFAAWLAVVAFWNPLATIPNALPESTDQPVVVLSNHPISPIRPAARLDARKVALGDRLFHERQLSRDGSTSCASCHGLDTAGVDRLPTSVGIAGAVARRNAPTVFNSGLNSRQFWDGRARSLEEQVDGPILGEGEMGLSWLDLVGKLESTESYVVAFGEIYDDGITARNVRDAISTFERSLVTPNSRFDRFLAGDADAITAEAKRGYHLFVSLGCSSCHQGEAVGGNLFQPLGILGRHLDESDEARGSDLGRYEVTRDEHDRYVFKVPSLRNVAATKPYFHDGSVPTLSNAIEIMGQIQLGRQLADDDIRSIAAFLTTLTGEFRGRAL